MFDNLARVEKELASLSAGDILKRAAQLLPGQLVVATGLGPEDQAITHLIAQHDLNLPLVMVDTGRLFQESHDLLERTRERYALSIKLVFPDDRAVESMIDTFGPNLFRDSPTLRARCCQVRKMHPLARALAPYDAWVSGLRREQSYCRQHTKVIEWDEVQGLYKINPLFNWHEKQLWDFIALHEVPHHELHQQGYTSLGCASCTRAVKAGEAWRDGRWWWEEQPGGESGLHGQAGPCLQTRDSLLV